MDEATTGGPNRSLIDDLTFISYLDDLDRGLRARNDGDADAEEPPVDLAPPPQPQSPFNPGQGHLHPPARALADDPNFRASLDALDWGLSGERASPQPVTPPTLVPRSRQQAPRSEPSDEALHVPAAWSAPEASAAGGRPLLDLFPVEPATVTHTMTPPVQPRASALRPRAPKAPVHASSDLSVDDLDVASLADLDDASLAALLEDDDADAGAQPFKRLGFAAYLVVMMLVGASLSALVFHARVSRIIVQWQSVSTGVSPPAATPVTHD